MHFLKRYRQGELGCFMLDDPVRTKLPITEERADRLMKTKVGPERLASPWSEIYWKWIKIFPFFNEPVCSIDRASGCRWLQILGTYFSSTEQELKMRKSLVWSAVPGLEPSSFRSTAILTSRFLPKRWHQGNCPRAPRPYQAHRICLFFDYHLNIIWSLSTHSGDINRKIPYVLTPIS